MPTILQAFLRRPESTPQMCIRDRSWAEYFRTYETDGGSKYPALKAVVKEFGYIDKYLGKINAIEKISTGFEGIRKMCIRDRTGDTLPKRGRSRTRRAALTWTLPNRSGPQGQTERGLHAHHRCHL